MSCTDTMKPRKIELQISEKTCKRLEEKAVYSGLTISELIEALADGENLRNICHDERLLYHVGTYWANGIPTFLEILEEMKNIKRIIKEVEEDPYTYFETRDINLEAELKRFTDAYEEKKGLYDQVVNEWRKKNPKGDLEKEMKLIWQFQKELDGLGIGLSQAEQSQKEWLGERFRPDEMLGKFHYHTSPYNPLL